MRLIKYSTNSTAKIERKTTEAMVQPGTAAQLVQRATIVFIPQFSKTNTCLFCVFFVKKIQNGSKQPSISNRYLFFDAGVTFYKWQRPTLRAETSPTQRLAALAAAACGGAHILIVSDARN